MNKIKWFIDGFKCGFYLEYLEGYTNIWQCIKYGLKCGIREVKQ